MPLIRRKGQECMMKNENPILSVENLTVQFCTKKGTAKVLNGLSFHLKQGEKLGLVGESGVGKSVAAWACLNIIKPPGECVAGKVLYQGENLLEKSEQDLISLRGNEISLTVPRAHSQLNPLLTIGDQLMNSYIAHAGLPRREAKKKAYMAALDILDKVGIPDPKNRMKAYPNELSGGMAQRVVIALALINNPTVLIADDPTGGLDVTIQAQIIELLNEMVTELGTTALIITHHLGLVAQHCDHVAIMYAGQIVESCPTETLFAAACHPYSKSMLSSVRDTGEQWGEEYILPGRPPSPMELPTGCYLNPRCPHATELCRTKEPPYVNIGESHIVKCHFAKKGGAAYDG